MRIITLLLSEEDFFRVAGVAELKNKSTEDFITQSAKDAASKEIEKFTKDIANQLLNPTEKQKIALKAAIGGDFSVEPSIVDKANWESRRRILAQTKDMLKEIGEIINSNLDIFRKSKQHGSDKSKAEVQYESLAARLAEIEHYVLKGLSDQQINDLLVDRGDVLPKYLSTARDSVFAMKRGLQFYLAEVELIKNAKPDNYDVEDEQLPRDQVEIQELFANVEAFIHANRQKLREPDENGYGHGFVPPVDWHLKPSYYEESLKSLSDRFKELQMLINSRASNVSWRHIMDDGKPQNLKELKGQLDSLLASAKKMVLGKMTLSSFW